MDTLSRFRNQVSSTRKIRVSRGLFVLRYASSKAGISAPVISIATTDDTAIEIISPSEDGAQLVCPGDGLVICAARDSLLDVSVTPLHPGGSSDAELVLERINTTIQLPNAISPSRDEAAILIAKNDIQILAHVSRRGDIVVAAGDWICGPDLPMAIEGLEIRWPNCPDGVDIVTRASVNPRHPQALPEKSIGAFQGTRGRAAAITSLSIALTGPRAHLLSLSCDALFLGQSITNAQGASCVVTGLTGREPLVGFRLSVAPISKQVVQSRGEKPAQTSLPLTASPPLVSAAPSAPLPAARQLGRNNRVRVFRSPNQRTSSLTVNS
jgi:hypothetical protein